MEARKKIYDLFTTLDEIPEPDTSYFRPWALGMLYEVEPELKEIFRTVCLSKGKCLRARLEAYGTAKRTVWWAGMPVTPG